MFLFCKLFWIKNSTQLQKLEKSKRKFSTKHVKLYFLPIFNFKKSQHSKKKDIFSKFENFEVMTKLGRTRQNSVQDRKKLYDFYDEKSLTERQCQNWFARFRSGDFDLKDAPRSGSPTEVYDDKIKAMIENNRRSMTRKIVEKLNMSHTRVERHLK